MRAGPVGLIFFDEPAQMVRAAHDQGRITHLDPRCSAGAIAAGGDVDTTAAMAGAISGARLGLEAIPPHLATRLNDQGTWGHRELVELAHEAHRIAPGAE